MENQLIIALDNLNESQALDKIKQISQECGEFRDRILFKVNDVLALKGLEGIKKMIEGTWARMMLDPKWHDIPKTLQNYMEALADSWLSKDSEYVTIHASNWYDWCKAVVDKKNELWIETKVLAVTALTSLEEQWVQVVFDETAKHAVLKLAGEALRAWVDGIVCSPLEVEVLREVYGEDFLIVNPGVRFADGDQHDQKRVLTPSATIENGSTDIVMGRPILEAENTRQAVERFFGETKDSKYSWSEWNFDFDKALYSGNWKELLSYIGAFYFRPEGGKYCRLASGLLSNAYINIGTTERNYLVVEKAAAELATQIREQQIEVDVVMWAQMWSVRSSLYLAEKLGIEKSIYTEKSWDDNEEMKLKRHDVSLKWKKVVISEDIVTKGSTLRKMKQMIEDAGGEVVAIACVGNRHGKDEFDGVPLISCYVPEQFELYWDERTLEKTRENLKEAWNDGASIEEEISTLQAKHPKMPSESQISEKPKNEWDSLVESMRQS